MREREGNRELRISIWAIADPNCKPNLNANPNLSIVLLERSGSLIPALFCITAYFLVRNLVDLSFGFLNLTFYEKLGLGLGLV